MRTPEWYDEETEKGTFRYATVKELEQLLELLPRVNEKLLDEIWRWAQGEDYFYKMSYPTGTRWFIAYLERGMYHASIQ